MPIEELKKPERIDEDRIDKLKELFPEVFTDGKVNIDILRQEIKTINEDIIEESIDEFYGLSWVGKREARKLAILPAQGTLKLIEGEGINEDTTKNIFIEGDNLEVLRILQKSYTRRVKLIYIDPPYNTGNDFIYQDDFTEPVDKYLQRTSQADEVGLLTSNPKANGRYHANWLNMMYPRLRLARNLLREDGVIFVSIDDHEFSNLKKVMDEVFGENNFVATFTWKRRASSAMADQMVSTDHEYILCYQKGNFISFNGLEKDYKGYSNPDNDPRGDWTKGDLTVGMTKDQRPNQYYDLIDPKTGNVFHANPKRVWTFIPESMNELIKEGRIIFPNSKEGQPMLKRYKSELKSSVNPISTWINGFSKLVEEEGKTHLHTGLNSEGTKTIQELFGEKVFDYPKPVSLIKSLIDQVCNDNDIVLDFFAGSGTTAQAILELNTEKMCKLQFILVQLPVKVNSDKFPTISEITKERIRRVISNLNESDNNKNNRDRGFLVFKLSNSNFTKWENFNGDDIDQLSQTIDLFEVSPLLEEANSKDIVIELMLQQGFPLDSNIEAGMKNGNTLWNVQHSEDPLRLVVCLDEELHNDTGNLLVLKFEKATFICLDSALTNQQKILLSESMNVKTI